MQMKKSFLFDRLFLSTSYLVNLTEKLLLYPFLILSNPNVKILIIFKNAALVISPGAGQLNLAFWGGNYFFTFFDSPWPIL